MDIAALSMNMSSNKLSQGVEIAVLKKAMDAQETSAQAMIESIQSTPSFGHLLDIKI